MRKNKIVKKLLILSLLSGISMTSVSKLADANYKIQRANQYTNVIYDDESKVEDTEGSFIEAIDNNQNLTEEYKESFKELNDYLLENPYLDEELIIYNLENFDVAITSSSDLKEKSALAYYDSMDNTVYLSENNLGLTHEAYHMTSDHHFTAEEAKKLLKLYGANFFDSNDIEEPSVGLLNLKSDLGRGINEGMTSLLDQEYSGGTDGYFFEVILVKMLCEVIGEDVMLESYTKGDVGLIVSTLKNITGNEEEATTLVKAIDDIYYEKFNQPSGNYVSYGDAISDAVNILNKYFLAKTGKTLCEDEVLNAYCIEIDQETGIKVVKGYFSESYKDKIGMPYIEEICVVTEKVFDDEVAGDYKLISYYGTNKTFIEEQGKDYQKQISR